MSEKKTETKTVRPTREMRRAQMRRAYDHLGKRWRQDRRTQKALMDLGLEVNGPLLGRKPPFSVFAECIPDGENPLELVKQSPPVEFLEYAHAAELRWSGDVPVEAYKRLATQALGGNVTTMDIAGNPHDESLDIKHSDTVSQRGVTTIDIAGGEEG